MESMNSVTNSKKSARKNYNTHENFVQFVCEQFQKTEPSINNSRYINVYIHDDIILGMS